MNINDIPTSLRVPAQVPLDAKAYVVSKEDLRDLGVNSYKAYTYYNGMRVLCANERETYEWKEVEPTDDKLLLTDFTYPTGVIAGGIDYSNKTYNFALVKSAEQNNKVKYIDIDISTVPDSLPPTALEIITYLNSLPINQRVLIEETDIYKIGITYINAENANISIPRSDWYNKKYIVLYDLVGVGKGRLPNLSEENISLSYYQEIVRPQENNIVRTIFIPENELPVNYTVQDVINYLLNLSEYERTIDAVTSKVNIVIDNLPS